MRREKKMPRAGDGSQPARQPVEETAHLGFRASVHVSLRLQALPAESGLAAVRSLELLTALRTRSRHFSNPAALFASLSAAVSTVPGPTATLDPPSTASTATASGSMKLPARNASARSWPARRTDIWGEVHGSPAHRASFGSSAGGGVMCAHAFAACQAQSSNQEGRSLAVVRPRVAATQMSSTSVAH